MDDLAEYWGGEPFPADYWGRAPIRGDAVHLVHELLLFQSWDGEGLLASRIVDRLIEAGILPDEMAEDV